MTFLDLKQKEVINCCDCKRIGCVADVDFDPECGKICGLIIPAPLNFLSCFSKNIRYYVRFCDIVKIGPDIILVEVNLEGAVMRDDC